jgi:hypothetical protein
MTMPDFIFIRDQEVEIEGGFVLAGTLITSIQKTAKPRAPTEREQEMISEAIERLTAESKQMTADAVIFIWGMAGIGAVPTDAEIGAWAKDHIKITVRIDPRPNDGSFRLCETDLRRMGINPDELPGLPKGRRTH